MPRRSMNSFAHALLHSRRAAALVGPKIASPREENSSTMPAASGASGPTTVRSKRRAAAKLASPRSEEHTSELQSLTNLVCRLLLEKKKKTDCILRFIFNQCTQSQS